MADLAVVDIPVMSGVVLG
jgi:hypothetical protein